MIFKRTISILLSAFILLGAAFASADPVSASDTQTEAEAPAVQESAEEPEPGCAEQEETVYSESTADPDDFSFIAEGSSTEPESSASGEASAEEEALPWQTPGNTDCEILSGGRMLYTDNGYYSSEGGIWYCAGTAQSFLCADDGLNLNLYNGYVYYTVGSDVRRVPCGGGSCETVYSFTQTIDELYVIGAELRFLSAGLVYSYSTNTDTLRQLDAPGNVTGLIPTEYGNLFLTGSFPNRILWTQCACLLNGITRCYTDSDHLVVIRSGETYQISLDALFSGSSSLQNYSLHSGSNDGSAMTDEDEAAAQQAYFSSSDFLALQDLINYQADGVYQSYNSNITSTAQSSGILTQSQRNIISRARQMAELSWTPLSIISWWTGSTSSADAYAYATDGSVSIGAYAAGKTYQGIPYSQPVYNKGYVGWDISLSEFIRQTKTASSPLYTGTSAAYADKIGPYYGLDCSGFVSFAWDLSSRRTVAHLRDSDVSANIAFSLQNLQVGDTLNRSGVHVMLVTDLGYDANGNIVSVEITEQIPPKVRVTCYGEIIPGRSYEYTNSNLSALAAYVNYGYGIYRRNVSTAVTAYSTDAVDLDDAVRDVTAVSQWVVNNGSRYYFDENGNMLTQQWLDYNGSRYYLGYNGKMYAGGQYTIDGSLYYFNNDGQMIVSGETPKNSWLSYNGTWYYFDSDGTLRTESWMYYSGSWYYFDASGKMVHGSDNTPLIITISGSGYAFNSSGIMLTGWVKQNNEWYYFRSGGAMITNSWLQSGSTWYYLDNNGKMLHGSSSAALIRKIGTASYAFDSAGAMKTGWVSYNGDWYYFQSGGAMITNSWLQSGSTWYYLGNDGHMYCSYSSSSVAVEQIGSELYGFSSGGAMKTGWGSYNGKWYYFASSGAACRNQWLYYGSAWYYLDSDGTMLASTGRTIDGVYYTFDASGRMQ